MTGFLRKYWILTAFVFLCFGVKSYGDYAATQGSGTTFISFDGTHSGTSRCAAANAQCMGVTLQNSAGTEVGTTAVPVKVDGSTVTQPVSGTVTAAQATAANLNATVVGTGTFVTQSTLNAETTKVIGTVRNLGNGGATLDFATGGTGQTAPGAAFLMGAQFLTTPPTLTNSQTLPFQMDSAGNLLVNIKAGGGAGGTSSTFTSAFPATGTAIGASDGTNMQALRVTTYGTAPTGLNALGVNAFVTNANANGLATMPNSAPVVTATDQTGSCTGVIAINQTTSTDLKTSVAKLNICSVVLISASAQNVSLVEGTGTVCATGIAALVGGTSASMALPANGGFSSVSSVPWLKTQTTADHLCLLQSGAGNVSGVITYLDHS